MKNDMKNDITQRQQSFRWLHMHDYQPIVIAQFEENVTVSPRVWIQTPLHRFSPFLKIFTAMFTSCISHSYSTVVASSKLRRHLQNMMVIKRTWHILIQRQIYFYVRSYWGRFHNHNHCGPLTADMASFGCPDCAPVSTATHPVQ